MKSLIYAVSAAVLLSSPLAVFAQEQAPVTRAQVKAQLIQLENAGYDPAQNDVDYPNNLLAAEARVNAQNTAVAANAVSNGANDSGSSISGSSQSSAPRISRSRQVTPTVNNPNSIYWGN
jgi:hypothetical protein